jgi:hypothetical protein
MIESWVVFCLYSLGIRWLIFDYKKTQFVRDLIGKVSLELLHCVYCQMIECSIIVYACLVLSGSANFNWFHFLFGALTNGLTAITIDGVTSDLIDKTEQSRDFTFDE